MRISNSKANTYRRCPKRYEYKYVQRLEKKSRAIQLYRGSWLHTLLEEHYNGGNWKVPHKALANEFNLLFEEEREELGDLPGECARIMKAYLRHWKHEDEKFKVIDSELDELITLPNGDEFNFIIDLIVEYPDGIWLWDHKTMKSFMDGDFMLLDAQLARYFWAAEQMGYTPLRGVMFNELRTKPPAIPELLKSGGLSQRKNIDTDYRTYALELKRHDLDPEPYRDTLTRLRHKTGSFFRRTPMPKDRALTQRTIQDLIWTCDEIRAAEEAERFPRTVNKGCTWDCDFKDVCITEYFGGDPSSLIKMNFRKRGKRQ